MPADPVHVVHATLRAELGTEWRQLVTYLEPEPIGSATIAQAHRRTAAPPHRRTAAPPHRRRGASSPEPSSGSQP